MQHYIIMADIIGSSSKSGAELMTHFKSMVKAVNTKYKSEIDSPLTITLGDEFQGIVKTLKVAIEIIFEMDELLLSSPVDYKLRYVINYGEIDTPISHDIAYEMLGDGLTKARYTLNGLKGEDKEVHVAGLAEHQNENLNMAFILYRSLYNSWSKKDKPFAAGFLKEGDYKKVAAAFDKDISSMWRREKSLKINEFLISKRLIQNLAYA